MLPKKAPPLFVLCLGGCIVHALVLYIALGTVSFLTIGNFA